MHWQDTATAHVSHSRPNQAPMHTIPTRLPEPACVFRRALPCVLCTSPGRCDAARQTWRRGVSIALVPMCILHSLQTRVSADLPEGLDAAYVAEVTPLAYGTFDHTAPGAFLYDLARRAQATAGAQGSRQRQKRLMREMRGLQSEDDAMVAPAASVFVRSDEERLDVVRTPPSSPWHSTA